MKVKRIVEKDFKKCQYVFVYGTLKRDYGNNYLLTNSKFICEAFTLQKFLLYDIGFPYAIPVAKNHKEGAYIKGELYKLDSVLTLERLDWLEGYPEHYRRKIIKVICKDKKVYKAWIYYVKKPYGKFIEKLKYDEDLKIHYKEWRRDV